MKNKVFSNTVCFRSASHLSHEGIHSDLRYLSQKLETSRENLNTNLKYITCAFFCLTIVLHVLIKTLFYWGGGMLQ